MPFCCPVCAEPDWRLEEPGEPGRASRASLAKAAKEVSEAFLSRLLNIRGKQPSPGVNRMRRDDEGREDECKGSDG